MFQRRYLPPLLMLSALLLSGCGNPDYGKEFDPNKKKNSKTAEAVTTTSGPYGNLSFGPCKNMTVFDGSNPALAQDFAGSSACASTSNKSVVRLRVSARFLSTSRVCLVPLTNHAAYTASCFTIDGQNDVLLSTDQFVSVALVYEFDLNSYMRYINGQSSSYPAMAFAALR